MTRVGAVHALPRVPARTAARDLYNQLDRVAQPPAAEDHPGTAATSPTITRPGERARSPHRATQSTRTPRRGPGHDELETSTATALTGLPRPHQPPPLTTMTANAYTKNLTGSPAARHRWACSMSVASNRRDRTDSALTTSRAGVSSTTSTSHTSKTRATADHHHPLGRC